MGALRDRMIEEMKLRNFSAATQKTYLYAVTRLANIMAKPRINSVRKISERFFYICWWSGSYRPMV